MTKPPDLSLLDDLDDEVVDEVAQEVVEEVVEEVKPEESKFENSHFLENSERFLNLIKIYHHFLKFFQTFSKIPPSWIFSRLL